MSSWPTATDYRDALQDPKNAFRDPRLKGGTVERNGLGVPRARSGAFANVYKLVAHKDTIAVRLFLYPERVREERYQVVREFLHAKSSRPSCLVRFDYDPQGIRIGNNWFPMLTMDWVRGVSLGVWVRDRVGEKDTGRLMKMAERWAHLLEELGNQKIAHGDLQHDNVMVVNDEPVLVDYDCMCVPRLIGKPALEFGKPAYQHPDRKNQPLSLELDQFSAWIILIALRALANDLGLYQRYVEKTGNENLLFREEDMREPGDSKLWKELLDFRDLELRGWARSLFELLPDGQFARIPPFALDPAGPVRIACGARIRDWEQIDRLARQLAQMGRPLPADLQPTIDQAKRKVSARDRLQQAIQAGKLKGIVAAYDPGLLDDWPACGTLVTRAKEARGQLPLLEDLGRAAQSPGDGRQLVRLWDQHGARLRDLAEATIFEQQAKAWKQRIAAAEELLRLVKGPGTEKAIAEAWQRLKGAGGHPDADGLQDRARQAAARAKCLESLRGIPDDNTDDNDRKWAQSWNEPVLQGCKEADPLRDRQKRTEGRIQLLDDLERTILKVDRGGGSEQTILDAAGRLPHGYRHRKLDRVRTARTRLATSQELRVALDANPPSDRAIATAWEKLDPAVALQFDDVTRRRCEQAVARRNCLDQIAAIGNGIPIDEQDRRWLAIWNVTLLRECRDAERYRDRHRLASERQQAWKSLEKALKARDLDNIDSLCKHALLVDYPPVERQRNAIDDLRAQARDRLRIRSLLSRNMAGFTGDDLRFLREHGEVVVSERPRIEAGLRTWLDAQGKLRNGSLEWIAEGPRRRLTARWTWPQFDLVTHCWVSTEPDRFLKHPDEGEVPPSPFDPASYRRGNGYTVLVLDGWEEVYVTVWPVIDLGWTRLVGPPLAIGPQRTQTRPALGGRRK